jgi:FkbH-like protein
VVAIAATFVAQPIEQTLGFWLQELEIPAQIAFAAYNQVFQELLDPSSLLATNSSGINIILARAEDWGNDPADAAEKASRFGQNVERNVRDFADALKRAAQRSHIPHLVVSCPPSVSAARNPRLLCNEIDALLVSELAEVSGIHMVTMAELAATYPVKDYYDEHAEELAHIPYTPVFFASLGTLIARKIFTMKFPRPKVIVLDCDQTLWGGVCGEEGALGVQIDEARAAIQEFMVRQHDAGMLFCLCSKNNEEDVFEVFDRRAEMKLKREHIASWRINWRSKSENIKSLAQELNLGLDSFVFIDDNPVEGAQVQANCPEILTFRLPENPTAAAEFLKNLWILDHLKVTGEAKARTEFYKQSEQRELARKGSLSLKDFLASLGLTVEISSLPSDHIPRAAELTHRTNQFNLTTIRRTEADIQRLCRTGEAECLVVRAKDRFGDYGMVGLIIFTVEADAIATDTFLLSCRALGRDVEHRMLSRLAEIAQQRGLSRVDVRYVQTKKNRPAIEFLDSVGAAFKESFDGGCLFRFPAEFAASVSYDSQLAERIEESHANPQQPGFDSSSSVAGGRVRTDLLTSIAEEMRDAERIYEIIAGQKRRRAAAQAPFVAPRLPIEQKLAAIYREVLGVDQIGVNDNFFDLGGHSLLAMQVLSRVRQDFQTEIPIRVLFTGDFSIAELAKAVGTDREDATFRQIDLMLNQLDGLSDEEIRELLADSDPSGRKQ